MFDPANKLNLICPVHEGEPLVPLSTGEFACPHWPHTVNLIVGMDMRTGSPVYFMVANEPYDTDPDVLLRSLDRALLTRFAGSIYRQAADKRAN